MQEDPSRPRPCALLDPDSQRELNEMIDRARHGDSEATSELLLRYRNLVQSTHARILGPTADGLDLIQETFTRALICLPRLADVRGFANWLRRIASNVAIDYLRKAKRDSVLQLVEPASFNELPAEAMDEAQLQRVRRIYALLDRLPTEERVAFSLRWPAERELKEVAEICNCSLATAKRRIKRGHEQFASLARIDPVLAEQMNGPLLEEVR